MKKKADIKEQSGENWYYSKSVKDHFFHPRNFIVGEPKKNEYDAEGEIGASHCGDIMRFWIKVDTKTKRITKCGWKTFGCASAIAATSVLSEMVTEQGGMKIDAAYKITPKQITDRLGGLPLRKVHCSILGDQALREAIDNYRSIHKS